MNLDEKGESYGLEEEIYASMAALGLAADENGLMITSLENLPNGEAGAELLLVGQGLGFAFAVEVRPSQLKLSLVPVDRNSQRERFRILSCDNSTESFERTTLAILRLGTWKPREEWTKALSKPVELGDLVIAL